MKIGIVGLGRMGAAITHRALIGGHQVIVFDEQSAAREDAKRNGAVVALSLKELLEQCFIVWLMVPAGEVVDRVLKEVIAHPGVCRVVVDGGNSHFSDSVRRYALLKKQGIAFLDCGTSGGLRGRESGFSLMIGGDREAYEPLKPFFESIAAPGGYAYFGSAGAGHYVKMVHNGIEYALLQAYGEGFELLRNGRYKELDLAAVARVWQKGSIIRSFIGELAQELFEQDQQLTSVGGAIGGGETGRWTAEEARAHNIAVPLIEKALEVRSASQQGGSFATKVVALLRNKFGGHAYNKEK